MNKFKVLLTTSGTGSRLGELTKTVNKALVPLNGRATIAYVLDSYGPEIPIVVTLGYLGDQVRTFLTATYPDRIFEFVPVDKFVGEGSSLLYSMRSAESHLQCPFIFHACDTIIIEPVPPPREDWVAGYVVEPDRVDISQYRSHLVADGFVTAVQDKNAPSWQSIHIGLTGVYDYRRWWETAGELYRAAPNDQALGDVPVIEKMLAQGTLWKWVPFQTWLDTGNISALKQTEEYLKNKVRP